MRVYQHAKRGRGNLLAVDPCPACGVRQSEHWRCKRCTARGHLLGHSDPQSPYCDDCTKELARLAAREAV